MDGDGRVFRRVRIQHRRVAAGYFEGISGIYEEDRKVSCVVHFGCMHEDLFSSRIDYPEDNEPVR